MIKEISPEFKKVITQRKQRITDAERKINEMSYTPEDMEVVMKFVDGGTRLYPDLKLTPHQFDIFEQLLEIKMSKSSIKMHEELKCEENIPFDVPITINGTTLTKTK